MAGFRYDVFLSYSFTDRLPVQDLARRLERRGLTPFYDEWGAARRAIEPG